MIKMDRVGVEPTTSGSFKAHQFLIKSADREGKSLFKSHPVHFKMLEVVSVW
jgi:hypothetical protein